VSGLPKVLNINKKLTPIYLDFGKKIGGEISFLYKKLAFGSESFFSEKIEEDFKERMRKLLTPYTQHVSFPFIQHTGHAICVSKNEEVAHGFYDGPINFTKDIVSFDFGVSIVIDKVEANFDFAFTLGPEKWVTEPQNTLKRIIREQPKTTFEISSIIEDVEMKKVVQLTGHGIGEELHQAPAIHNMIGKFNSVPLINGMAFCPEPIYTKKTEELEEIEQVYMEEDKIKTMSGFPSTHWETTILKTEGELIDVIGITEL